MRAHDTSPEAHQAQFRAYRRLTPDARVAMAVELSESVRLIAIEGIRNRHPQYSDDEVSRALLALLYGRDLAQRVWPRMTVPPP